MKIENVIEKLTAYAAINLMAEQADEIYIKNKLSDMAGIACFEAKGVDEDEIYDMENCDALVGELVSYALKNGVVSESKKLQFQNEIYATISLVPSKVNEIFFDLYDLKPAKAFEWLEDYSKRAGVSPKIRPTLVQVDESTDAVYYACEKAVCGTKLKFIDEFATCFQLENNPVLPKQAYFSQPRNKDLLSVVAQAAEFAGYSAFGTTAKNVAYCFDYELPIMRAKATEKVEILGVEAEKLDWKNGAIRVSSKEEAKALVEKIISTRPQGMEIAVCVQKDGKVIVTAFNGGEFDAVGIKTFAEEKFGSVFKLCAKYLSGSAIYSQGNLTDEYKPYEEMIGYVVSKGKASSSEALGEVIKRVTQYFATNSKCEANIGDLLAELA